MKPLMSKVEGDVNIRASVNSRQWDIETGEPAYTLGSVRPTTASQMLPPNVFTITGSRAGVSDETNSLVKVRRQKKLADRRRTATFKGCVSRIMAS